MERVIELLERKNQYLEKFFVISEAELLNFEQGDFANLESFYDCREKILNIIRHIDKEIDRVQQEFGANLVVPPEKRQAVRQILVKKDQYVSQILVLDLKIISAIDNTKSLLIREMGEVNRALRVVNSYHSGAEKPSRLDEKV